MKSVKLVLVAIMIFLQIGCSLAQGNQPPAKVTFTKLFSKDKPAVPRRGVHMDLKGLPPTADRFVGLLKIFAAARYNVVLIEWEDSFPLLSDPKRYSASGFGTGSERSEGQVMVPAAYISISWMEPTKK